MKEISKYDNLYKFIAIFLLLISFTWEWFFLFWMFYMLWYVFYYISTNDDRKDKREWEKQKRLELAEEAKNKRIEEEQERLTQQKKRKEEEFKKYTDWRSQIEQMPIYKKWKQDVVKKCGNKCQFDESHENRRTEVHHIISLYNIYKQINSTLKEDALKCKLLWDVENGAVLCEECHDEMESSQNRQAFLAKNNKS